MKNLSCKSPYLYILISFLSFSACDRDNGADYPIKAVPFYKTKIEDTFWSLRLKNNQHITIPHAFKHYSDNGIIRNFEIAAGFSKGEQSGNYPFDESDLYKTIEGASYVYMVTEDRDLKGYLNELINKIRAAQEEDGYIYTSRTNNAVQFMERMGPSRWSNLKDSHELYNAGHLYEAAVAHYLATGDSTLLDVALNNADLVLRTFGPGKLMNPPGHQEIELGLIKLFRTTGNDKYLDLARFFLEQRSRGHNSRQTYGTYAQDHKPVVEQEEAVGHAVRAPYMYSAMADIASLTGDRRYRFALDQLWHNVTEKKLYVTGGIGSVGMGECFAGNYDLPNMTAYNETCSSIALMMWNQRLFLLTGDAKYVDVFERTLYNAFLAGVSMEGNRFFYDNPLASRGQHRRREWLYCACCISNLTRFFPGLPEYIYACNENSLFVNLFIAGTTSFEIHHTTVNINQSNNYPWDGKIHLTVSPQNPVKFTVQIRVPGWARGEAIPGNLYQFVDENDQEYRIFLNDQLVQPELFRGYIRLDREWRAGDRIELMLPMPVRRLTAHKNVSENMGKTAIQRGPLVYCAESTDQPDGQVAHLILPENEYLESQFIDTLLNGIVVLEGTAIGSRFDNQQRLIKNQRNFMAIPYYTWAHRGKSAMEVWIAVTDSTAIPLNSPSIASYSRATSSGGSGLESIHDGIYPSHSAATDIPLFSWSGDNDTVWVQYDFPDPEEISETHVFWAHQLTVAKVNIPKSWRILVRTEENQWRSVWSEEQDLGIEMDIFNKKVFETVKTTAVRLEVILEPGFTAGIFEWCIF
jgi:DUF1680 family protein